MSVRKNPVPTIMVSTCSRDVLRRDEPTRYNTFKEIKEAYKDYPSGFIGGKFVVIVNEGVIVFYKEC